MKKSIRLFTLLLIGGLMFSACKSKQVITIPNAHVAAGVETRTETSTSTQTSTQTQTERIIISTPAPAPVAAARTEVQPVEVRTVEVPAEDIRSERFRLDAEEKNTAVLNQKYHVVVGSFRNRSNAAGLQQSLNREGNNAVIVVNEQGMFRVLIASYNTQSDARAKIRELNHRFSDAWLLMQRQ